MIDTKIRRSAQRLSTRKKPLREIDAEIVAQLEKLKLAIDLATQRGHAPSTVQRAVMEHICKQGGRVVFSAELDEFRVNFAHQIPAWISLTAWIRMYEKTVDMSSL